MFFNFQIADFNIYTREAGAGALAIAIEGPAKAEIDFHDRKDGTCGVSYVCPEPGAIVVYKVVAEAPRSEVLNAATV